MPPSRAPNSGLAAYDALPGAVAKYGKPSLATTVAEPKPPPARLLKAQISERADRRERCDYLVCPYISRARPCQPAAGQRAFAVESDVTVRADSFACKETSELDRLLQRNQSGGFTSGTQLYDYLKAHKCIGLTAGRARVYSTQGQYVCIYEPKNNKMSFYPCAWTRREMLSQ